MVNYSEELRRNGDEVPKCLECGRDRPLGMQICPYCGARHCASCGQKLPHGVESCPICGRSTKPSVKLEKRGVPLGEVIVLIVIIWLTMGMLSHFISSLVGVALIGASFVVGVILMRKEYPGPWPLVTVALILVNVAVFAAFELTGVLDQAISNYGLRPTMVLRGVGLPTLLTSFFMHASWDHLLGNMLALFIMGYILERRVGGTRFLSFYVLAGLAVSLADLAMRSGSAIPAVGASGAISGVLGACFIGAPRAKAPLFFLLSMLSSAVALIGFVGIGLSSFFVVVAFVLSFTIFILMIYALFDTRFRITWYALPFVAVWILAQALLAAYAGLGTGVHYLAHVVGFLVGMGGWFLIRKREEAEEKPAERLREEIPAIG